MDLIQKESSLCEEEEEEEEEEDIINETTKKCCTICKTTKTPLWRVGPSGPKSLCNACGIRYKKKGTVIGLKKISEKKQKKTSFGGTVASSNSTITNTSASRNENGLSESMKMELMALGKEVVLLQRQRSVRRQQRRGRRRRKMGEEEQAAVLLMALSCGSVFA